MVSSLLFYGIFLYENLEQRQKNFAAERRLLNEIIVKRIGIQNLVSSFVVYLIFSL